MVSPLGSVPESPGEGTPEGDTSVPIEAARPETEAKFLIEDATHIGDLIDSFDSYDVRSASAVDIVDGYWDTPAGISSGRGGRIDGATIRATRS